MSRRLENLNADLLLTLSALLEDPNVTRVAARLGLTQPALSGRLARLRDLFDDRLFVAAGSGRGLVATERARALQPEVDDLLVRMRDLLAEPDGFDPATSERTFVIATHDNPAAMLAPDLVPRVLVGAPGVPGGVRLSTAPIRTWNSA